MEIDLTFADPISEAYREKLQTFSDNVLAQGITENPPPNLWFSGMNRETFSKIYELRGAFSAHHKM